MMRASRLALMALRAGEERGTRLRRDAARMSDTAVVTTHQAAVAGVTASAAGVEPRHHSAPATAGFGPLDGAISSRRASTR